MIVVDLGYRSFVMETKDAVALVDILAKAEVWEKKYWQHEEKVKRGMTNSYTYHVYEQEQDMGRFPMVAVSDSLYRMAKVAGKPEDLT